VSDMPIHTQAPPPATGRRTAWVIVIIMSTFFVLALLGTIWGFLRQAHIFMVAKEQSKASANLPMAAPAEAQSGAAATVILSPGARILSATTDSGKLVLHVATPEGSEVDIIDLATGKLTSLVRTAPERVGASRSADKSVGASRSADKSVGASRSADKSAGASRSADKPPSQ